jgi:replicative DNA helicase
MNEPEDFEAPAAISDPEAERAVIAAALLDKAAMLTVEGQLRVEHLHTPPLRFIYAAMLDLAAAARPVDIVTTIGALRERGDLDEAGGAAFVAGLVDGVPRGTNVDAWLAIVREKARRRRAIAIASLFVEQAATRTDATTDELLDHVHAQLSRLMEGGERKTVRMGEALRDALAELERFAAAPDGVIGIPTGLGDLDRTLGGLVAGRLYVVAARTSRGKSVLCAQVAASAAAAGHKVLAFSMEMKPSQFASRMLQADAEVDRWDLRHDSPSREYAWSKITRSFGNLIELPIAFDPRESPTIAEIRTAARQHHGREGLGLVVVDFLQRATVDAKLMRDGNNWLGVGDIAKGLKSLAMGLNVAVLAACQLNADAEERRPTLANLGQSQGIISTESDAIVLLHPEDLPRWKTQPFPIVNFFVDKNRHGPCLALQFSFEKACSRFVPVRTTPPPKETQCELQTGRA